MTLKRNWLGKVFIATSLDGYIARLDGDITWLTDEPGHPEHVPAVNEIPVGFDYDSHMASVDHLVMGRKTYDKVCTFGLWPYPEHQVWVLSRQPDVALQEDKRVKVVGSVVEVVEGLNQAQAKGVYVDGGQVAQAFSEADLIDEWVVTRVPIILGSGLPLFVPTDKTTRLIHLGSIAAAGGMVTSRYRVQREALAYSSGGVNE